MNIPEEFKTAIMLDMEKIQKAIDSYTNVKDLLSLHKEIDNKYQECVKNWYVGIHEAMFPSFRPPYIEYGKLENDKERIIENLNTFKNKLSTLFHGMNLTSINSENSAQVTVTTNIDLNMSFEQARSRIENMGSLSNDQTKEILDKIAEIEKTVNSSDSSKSKWGKLKDILIWIADKGVDVGLTLLPLLLKI